MADKLEIPQCPIQLIRNMYVDNKGVVCIKRQEQKSFNTNTGVKQGDGASPKLFCIFFD